MINVVIPVVLTTVEVLHQGRTQGAIVLFTLPIRLWMIGRGLTVADPKTTADFLVEFTGELPSLVCDEDFHRTVAAHHLGNELYYLIGMLGWNGLRFRPLGQIVCEDDDVLVSILGGC